MNKTVNVVQKAGAEVPTELLASSIVAIAQGITKLRNGRLNDKALFLLIQHAAPGVGSYGPKPTIGQIKAVFDGIDALERTYVRKKAAAS